MEPLKPFSRSSTKTLEATWNSVKEKPRPDQSPENYSPTNGTTNPRSQERDDIQEQHSVEIGSSLHKTRECPNDECTTSAYMEVMDTPILQPSDRTPTLHRPIIDDGRRELDKLLDRFEIDP